MPLLLFQSKVNFNVKKYLFKVAYKKQICRHKKNY